METELPLHGIRTLVLSRNVGQDVYPHILYTLNAFRLAPNHIKSLLPCHLTFCRQELQTQSGAQMHRHSSRT